MNTSHQMLSHLAEHKRDKEAVALQDLTEYRSKLEQMKQQSSSQLTVLQQQREAKISHGAEAAELMLLEQSLQEHRLRIAEVNCELAALDIAIKQQKEKWVAQHNKLKTHEKLHQKQQRKITAVLRQKTQLAHDDQFASTMVQQERMSQ
ncbi:MAG TPA: hypothetical protein EYG66_08710 [Mariprofundaceae bacterium]|nr:hypothetical protein [Mariprofundaceae bacterium]